MIRILMCRPDYYGIEYAINPWMDVTKKANHLLALKQWESLYQILLKCGAEIDLVSPATGWPDMVFTANAGLFYKNKILLSHFKYKERQGELPYFQAWFEKSGFDIANHIKNDTPYFEGAGDALLAGDQLFVGYGFRSEHRFYKQESLFNHHPLIECELVNPHYYHLDTCFCPLNETLAIWYPAAFSLESQKKIAAAIELIDVNDEEAKKFACNAVVLDNNIILPTGCPKISAELEKRGLTIHAQEMSEYLKAGGACKCLTLRIN